MIEQREFSLLDAKMFYVMDALKMMSKCSDKQVVCILVDEENNIVSIGINRVVNCDHNCHDKEHRVCEVSHAEKEALLHYIREQMIHTHIRAYVNLFPCKACQEALDPWVDEIVTFGMAHKEWVSDKLLVFGHPYYHSLKNTEETKTVAKALDAEAILNEITADVIGANTALSILQEAVPTSRDRFSLKLAGVYSKIIETNSSNKLIAYNKTTYLNKSR